MKKTKIIATVGPACRNLKTLQAFIEQGVDVFRINASHTTPEDLKSWIRLIHKSAAGMKKPVAVMADLQGPRVRTGKLKDHKQLILKTGENVSIIPGLKAGSGQHIATPCLEFPQMVKAGDRVLLDNGFMELVVLSAQKKEIKCRVVSPGVLGENKGINLPNAPVTLPAFGAKDRADLEAAIAAGVDYIALSFVRSEKDVLAVKNWMKRRGTPLPIIAKIEKPRAIAALKEILKVSDGIMIARGDLGIEMGVEKVPFIQKQLILQANRLRIPVITATQMLESMITSSRPTRAEASDVANAVFDGTDAVMLSGETAIGKHPVEVIRVMAQIIHEAEIHMGETLNAEFLKEIQEHSELPIHAITHAARHAAKDLHARAIIAFTSTGKTAGLISKFRPKAPVIALTPSDAISRRMSLWRGVYAVKVRYGKTIDAMIRDADKALQHSGFLKAGDVTVLVSGRLALPTARYLIKIHWIGDPDLGTTSSFS